MAKHDKDVRDGKKEEIEKINPPSEEEKKSFNIRQPRESDKYRRNTD